MPKVTAADLVAFRVKKFCWECIETSFVVG